MTLLEAIEARHSVRQYIEKPLEEDVINALNEKIDELNKASGLHFQLVANEPKAFDSFMAHYGKFKGVTNYFALVGPRGKEEEIGYYGEKLVLFAQQLGLNTCWVAMSYQKVRSAYKLDKGEKLYVVVGTGYGKIRGLHHKSKKPEDVAPDYESAPEWFKKGVRCALLAPTAMNQQKFTIKLVEGKPVFKCPIGIQTKTDLGIVKCHFEIGSSLSE